MRKFLTLLFLLMAVGAMFSTLTAEAVEPRRETVNIGGLTREYQVTVPSSYRQRQAVPLVILFHGGGGTSSAIVNQSGYADLAEREGFILAAPQGYSNTWNAGSGLDQGDAERANIDDLGFVRAMLARIERDYSIDRSRVYLTGMSKGGMLTYYLACNMSAEIAAITVVSATMTAATCAPVNPVAVLHIHGDADTNVPLAGGQGLSAVYPPVQRGVDIYRINNGCTAPSIQRRLSADTFCTVYGGCSSDVRLCIVPNGEHEWPDFAAGEGWDSFQRHSKVKE